MGRFAIVGAVVLAACGRIGFDDELTPEVADQARATVAVGDITACAIRDDGDVWCWGAGENGQFGGEVSPPVLRPRLVAGVPKATRIAVGHYHVCMVSVAAEVWCWGGNDYGRVGVSSPPGLVALPGGPATFPVNVDLPGPAIEVSVSNDASCAVLASGAIWCWGRNHNGQLGRGALGTELGVNLPAPVMNISDARRISLDDDSACALRVDGTVACWGENGRGLIDNSDTVRVVATPVAGFANASAIALGGDHVCAVIDGRVGCRGAGTSGELGNGREEDSDDIVYASLDDAVAIEAGFLHTCAVRATGATACWGANNYYVLGDGTVEDRLVPTPVAGLSDAIAITTGEVASCAVRAGGAITCWGYGAVGLLGDGRSAELRARAVSTLPGSDLIAVGRDHSCASNTTAVACWGANKSGQLGTGGPRDALATPQVLPFQWPSAIAQLVAGELYTCALLMNDEVYCWGANHVGQLGLGDYDARPTPVRVPLPATASVAAGREHACALGMDRAVRCWGYNGRGQLGDGTLITQPSPVQVQTNVDGIALGDEHSCVRKGTQVACWGANDGGQLGDGTQVERSSAVTVNVMATNLRAGGAGTCAEKETGGVACWGINESNMFDAPSAGYNVLSPTDSSQPQLFWLGGSTACANGSCWGSNYLGNLGVGDFGYHGPSPVLDLPGGLSTFAISRSHTCASRGGQIFCWGENASGEIGAGTTSSAPFAATTVAFP